MSDYALTNVRNAQDAPGVKAACGADGTDERSHATCAAKEAGDVASVSGLSGNEVLASIDNLSEAAYS